jgi:hypothetical protein
MNAKRTATCAARHIMGKKQRLTGRTYEHLAALEPSILADRSRKWVRGWHDSGGRPKIAYAQGAAPNESTVAGIPLLWRPVPVAVLVGPIEEVDLGQHHEDAVLERDAPVGRLHGAEQLDLVLHQRRAGDVLDEDGDVDLVGERLLGVAARLALLADRSRRRVAPGGVVELGACDEPPHVGVEAAEAGAGQLGQSGRVQYGGNRGGNRGARWGTLTC